MTIHDIDPDYPPEAWPGRWKNVKERGSLTVESRHRTRDGRVFPVEITANYVEFEGKEYNCAFARDITERKHAEEQIQHQLDNLAALHAIDSAITSSVDLTATLQVVLEQITTRLKIDAADVLLFDEHTLMLEYAAGRGFRSASSRSKSLRIGSSYAGSVAIERKMLYIPNILEDDNAPRIAKTLWLEEGLVTYFGVPLIIKGELKGILELFHRSQLEPDKEWLGFLDTLATQTAIAIDNTILFNDLHRTNLELELAYETTLEGWASALELRDYETKGHSTRVVSMTMQMSERLGISGEELVSLRRGALLHDIGKMGVPDSILLKPGPLTASEWELMKRHPLHGYEMLKSITFLKPSLEIVLSHHERWDGAGYPNGTKGKDIPLPARIFAIVDVWDSLTSDRPYRKAWSREKTLAYIQEQSGTHFDPGMVEAFLNIQELLLTS